MYQRVQNLAHSMVADRRGSAGRETFTQTWEAPGFITVVKGKVLSRGMWSPAFVQTVQTKGGDESGEDGNGEGIAIYTDGSGSRSGASWGLVVDLQNGVEKASECGWYPWTREL